MPAPPRASCGCLLSRRDVLHAGAVGALGIAGGLAFAGRGAAAVRGRAAAAAWEYEGPAGPDHWASLDPAYAGCATGRSQSPIALGRAHKGHVPELKLHYRPSKLKVQNLADKHTIEIEVEGDNFITINDRRFDLIQFHFHHPSEHTIKRHRGALECHIVHQTTREVPPKQGTAVLGILIDPGRPGRAEKRPIYHDVIANAPRQPGATPVDLHREYNPATLLPRNPERYHYWGSLTIPACTEGVEWNVFSHRIVLPTSLINAYAALYPHSNRPLQPLNGRPVSIGG